MITPIPQYVRHMDYLREAVAMKGRYRLNSAAWQSHLEQSRRFILSCAEQCPERHRVVVLGAGLLLDVPLEELAALFKEVVLADIVFLPKVRRRTKRFSNVRLLQHDATGMSEKLYAGVRAGVRVLPQASPRNPKSDAMSMVVSLNLLSQLWVMPRAFALRNIAGLDEEQVDSWCAQIVESHYAFLSSLPCAVCLVADHAFAKRDREGAVVSSGSTVYSLRLPEPDTSWTWNIAPDKEGRTFLSQELTVGAWYFKKEH